MPMIKNSRRLQRRNAFVGAGKDVRHLLLNSMVGCSGCGHWLRFQGCVVTGACADGQASTSRLPGLYLYDPIGPVLLLIRRHISDGVLVTNITSDLFGNRNNFLQAAREESVAACGPCKLSEHTRVPVGIV